MFVPSKCLKNLHVVKLIKYFFYRGALPLKNIFINVTSCWIVFGISLSFFYRINLNLLILTYKLFIISSLPSSFLLVCWKNSLCEFHWSSMSMHITIAVWFFHIPMGRYKSQGLCGRCFYRSRVYIVPGMLTLLNEWVRWSKNNSSKTNKTTRRSHCYLHFSSSCHLFQDSITALIQFITPRI